MSFLSFMRYECKIGGWADFLLFVTLTVHSNEPIMRFSDLGLWSRQAARSLFTIQ